MTTDLKPLTNRAAGLLIGIRHLLNRRQRPTATNQTDGAHMMSRQPAADELVTAAHDLERYAGPALAAPILRAADRAAGDIYERASELNAIRHNLSDMAADQSLAIELLTQAAEVIDSLGETVVDAVLAHITAEARLEVIEWVLDQRADLGSASRRAGVMREANKRADRLARERRTDALGLADAATPAELEDARKLRDLLTLEPGDTYPDTGEPEPE